MKNPTCQNDIDEMRRSGYEADTLLRAEAKLAEYLAVAEPIKAAFAGVKLGNGVGLQEAQGIDDCADAETQAQYRSRDEKDDWRNISDAELIRCHSSLSFFDAEGMRFHLPAFLLADLRANYRLGIEIQLIDLSDYRKEQFSLLNSAQKLAVRGFLLYAMNDPEYEMDHTKIKSALKDFWTEQPI